MITNDARFAEGWRRILVPETMRNSQWVRGVQQLLFELGYQLTSDEAALLWQAFSASRCAGWLDHDRERALECIEWVREKAEG